MAGGHLGVQSDLQRLCISRQRSRRGSVGQENVNIVVVRQSESVSPSYPYLCLSRTLIEVLIGRKNKETNIFISKCYDHSFL